MKLILPLFISLLFITSSNAFEKLSVNEGDYYIPGSNEAMVDYYFSEGGLFVIPPYFDETKKLYDKADKNIDIVMKAFKKAYPELKDFPNPSVAIYEEKSASGAVIGARDDQPWGITLSSGLLNEDENIKNGLIAHELVHLVQRHIKDIDDEHIKKVYRPKHLEEKYKDEDKKKLEEDFRLYFNTMSFIGSELRDEFHSTPYSIWSGDEILLEKALIGLLGFAEKNDECKETIRNLSKLRTQITQNIDYYELKLNTNKDTIQTSINKFEESAKRCFKDKNYTFYQLLASAKGDVKYGAYDKDTIEASDLRTEFVEQEFSERYQRTSDEDRCRIDHTLQIFELEESSIDAIMVATKFNHEIANELNDKWNFEDIRFYTPEDMADELAVKVLENAGLDASGVADLLLLNLSKEERKKCIDTVKKDQEPYYGGGLEIHHTNCWRYWNIKNNFMKK